MSRRGGGEKQREREKQIPHQAGSPVWGPIPGIQDHDPSQRQMPHQLSHPGTPGSPFLMSIDVKLVRQF